MKKIVIIGASSGLGYKIASDFAEAGWKVGVAARRMPLLQELQKNWSDRMVAECIDVTKPDAVEKFDLLVERLGGMDIMLYCSGTGFADTELADDKIDNTLAVNASGFARLISAAYRYFRTDNSPRRGQIAAITSVAGTKGIGIAAAYSATKRFQQTYLNALRQLANQQNVDITITDIRPGFIRTDLLNSERKYPMIMTVDYAAKRIVKAIMRKRSIAYIDLRWKMLITLWRAIPQRLWQLIKIDF